MRSASAFGMRFKSNRSGMETRLPVYSRSRSAFKSTRSGMETAGELQCEALFEFKSNRSGMETLTLAIQIAKGQGKPT